MTSSGSWYYSETWKFKPNWNWFSFLFFITVKFLDLVPIYQHVSFLSWIFMVNHYWAICWNSHLAKDSRTSYKIDKWDGFGAYLVLLRFRVFPLYANTVFIFLSYPELKHQGKKQSRSAKSSKNKGKELEKREARLDELREKLRKKLEDMKGLEHCFSPLLIYYAL